MFLPISIITLITLVNKIVLLPPIIKTAIIEIVIPALIALIIYVIFVYQEQYKELQRAYKNPEVRAKIILKELIEMLYENPDIVCNKILTKIPCKEPLPHTLQNRNKRDTPQDPAPVTWD